MTSKVLAVFAKAPNDECALVRRKRRSDFGYVFATKGDGALNYEEARPVASQFRDVLVEGGGINSEGVRFGPLMADASRLAPAVTSLPPATSHLKKMTTAVDKGAPYNNATWVLL